MSLESDSLQKILTAAKEIFSEYGFAGARIDLIAQRAGVNKAMIYYHFKSKEDLYHAIIDLLFEKRRLIDSFIEDDSLSQFEKLEKCIRYLSDAVSCNTKERCSIIAREMVSRGETFQLMRDKYWIPEYLGIRKVIEVGIAKGEFKKTKYPIDFIVFTILSHIFFYRISEITYSQSEIYDSLYPPNNEELNIQYTLEIIKKFLL
ncbi:MAG: TetR/AcrR family transcriptional regulator [Leptospiraceae bacterium]|nr:TetR/AcrR family transcriptional regulator [Leptospiraceae bacterium]